MILQANEPEKPAECEACPAPPVKFQFGMWLCMDCIVREATIRMAQVPDSTILTPEQSLAKADELNQALEVARSIDASIQVKTDIFNARTLAIADLKRGIDQNPSIEAKDKNYELAKQLKERFIHLKQVIFDLREQEVAHANEQRAIQVYLNDLATKLREDERKKLQLAALDYKPEDKVKPAPVKKISTKQIDKARVREIAKELNLPESVVSITCLARNLSPDEAANFLRRTVAEQNSMKEGN